MKNIKTDIVINAPTSVVWEVLMDFKNFGQWNPFVTSIDGVQKEGEVLDISIKPQGGKPMKIKPTVIKIEANKEFRWLGHLFVRGLFDGEHYFILEPIDNQTTRLIHGENFKGLLMVPILKMVGKGTLAGFKSMNENLKSRVEQINVT